MPWKPETVMEQKVEFVVRAKSGEECLSELCAEYGISRPTGYLWLRRYEENGTIAGLTERSRRPHRSPKRTSSEWEARVLQLRDEKGWGARKLAFVLAKRGVSLHTQTVHRILERHGRIREGESVRLAVRRFAREQCNELAQMDFKGEYQLNEGKCYPLSLLDDCSRYLLGLWPLSSTGAEGVYRTLKAHFKSVGVPQAMLVDHGTPWYGTTSQHGLTWLSVWLIKQGVRLTYSGVGHPQTQGKVERFHQTLKRRTRHRGLPATLREWRRWAPQFRFEYNHERPHEALSMKTPAEIYNEENLKPYQDKPPEWEYSGGMIKRLNTQGMLYYEGRTYFVSEALATERVRVDTLDDKLVVTFRHLTIREIDLRAGSSAGVLFAESQKAASSSDKGSPTKAGLSL